MINMAHRHVLRRSQSRTAFSGAIGMLVYIGLAIANCLGQDGPGRDGPNAARSDRRSSDAIFWSVMRDVHKQVFSSRMDFMSLLSHPSIRAEVGIDDEEFDSLSRLNISLFNEIKTLQRNQSEEQLDRQELVAKVANLMQEHEQLFIEHIKSVTDFDRFIEILVQARGNRSVVHEEVARRISLPADKLDELREVSHKAWREQMDGLGEKIRELIRKGELQDLVKKTQNQEIRQLVKRAELKVNESLGQRMTSEQLEALRQIRGVEFAVPDDAFDARLPHLANRRRPRSEEGPPRERRRGNP